MIDIFKNVDFSQLANPEFKEDSVREEIIVPLLNALELKESGYKLHRSKKLLEPFVRVGSKFNEINIFPDYAVEY
ncbi:MAG: restriction endonuclease, partial [Alphaproteobacteria bacterium]